MNYENYVVGTLSQDSFVMVNKELAKKIGFVEAGLLAELIFTYKSVKQNNAFFENGEHGPWFFLTQAKVEEDLGIKRREHENAIKTLVTKEIIFKKKMGLPSKNYYVINWKKIVDIYDDNEPEPAPQSVCTKRTNKDGRNVQTSMDETYNQDWTKHPSIHINKNNLEKRDIKINNKNLVNKENDNQMENSFKQHKTDYDGKIPYEDFIINTTNEFYAEFAVGRWSKKEWTTLVLKIADELPSNNQAITNHKAYIHSWLKNIAYRHDFKNNKVEFDEKEEYQRVVPFYNWLES